MGCVLQRDNIPNIEDVIHFGKAISWYASLVPVHVTDYSKPMNFRTYDQSLRFHREEYPYVDALIERVRAMRKEGFPLYDSDQYLDDIKRFVRNEPTTWRGKNEGVCDSPNLYFAVLPNGEFAPCCDHRLPESIPVYDNKFPTVYRDSLFRKKVLKVTGSCSGCMYGSYPEMTIAMRFWKAKFERMMLFMASPPEKNWPVSYERMLELAEKIRNESRERVRIPEGIISGSVQSDGNTLRVLQ